jgi:hypothetical protein
VCDRERDNYFERKKKRVRESERERERASEFCSQEFLHAEKRLAEHGWRVRVRD